MDNKFSLADLKKQIAINTNSHSPDLEITLCYSGRHVLVKPLKVKEKKELLKSLESKNEIIINKVLDDIIQEYVIPTDSSEFNPKELPTQERHQILIYIRAANGDEIAKVAHQCPKCEKVTKDIPYAISKDSYVKQYEEPADGKIVTICNGLVEIHYDVILRYEEMRVEEFIKNKKLKSMSEKQFAMIAAAIKEIYMVTAAGKQKVDVGTIDEKLLFIEDLDTKEFTKILEAVNSLDFGVKMPFDFKCSECDYTAKEEVNATVFFIS
jgi:hypothetical protein